MTIGVDLEDFLMSRGNFIISFVEKMPLCIFLLPTIRPQEPMGKMKVFEAAKKTYGWNNP